MEVEQEDDAEAINQQAVYISDLPEELIEYIFFHLSPYRDLQSAKLVCRQWYRLVLGVIRQLEQNFHDAIACSQVLWTQLLPGDNPSITERYSHCACYYDKSLYIFGGCTSTNTTFNDLWRFNLATRQWVRPLATGNYPSPKACASMVVYKDSLVLFGGWSHPTPSPLHQAARFFNELHIYTPHTNKWSYVTSRIMPQLVAGHSACVVKDSMIVFGGSNFPGVGSNDIWVFDFIERYWYKKEIYGPQPSPRYGQSQIAVDDNHILIIGGCGGPNQIFNDVWLLVLGPDDMHWEEIKVLQSEYSAPQLWCHPACKVHDTVVVLSKPVKSMKLVPPSLPKWSQLRGQRFWQEPQPNRSSHLSSSTSSQAVQAGSTSADRPDRWKDSSTRKKNDTDAANASWFVHGDHNADLASANIRNSNSSERNGVDMNHLSSQERKLAEFTHNFSVNGASSGHAYPTGFSANNVNSMDELTSSNAPSPNGALSSASVDIAASGSLNGFNMDSRDSVNGSLPSESSLNRSSPDDGSVSHSSRFDGSACNGSINSNSFANSIASRAGASASNSLPSTSGSGHLPLPGHSPLNNVSSSRFYHLSMRPNRQKQLEMLQRYEDKIKRQQQQRQHRPQPSTGFLRNNHRVSQGSNLGPNCSSNNLTPGTTTSSFPSSSTPKEPRSRMHLHNLDISKVVTEKVVTWQQVRENISDCIPEEAISYSLVKGRGELIMFGGIQRDINSMQRGVRIKSHVVSNNLYVLSSPRPNF